MNRLLGLAVPARWACTESVRGASLRRNWIAWTGMLAALFVLGSCNTDPEYEQLNLESDCLFVEIAPEGALSDDDDDSAGDDDDSAGDDDDSGGQSSSEISLFARPGLFADGLLGTAFVSPGGGPAGTHFLITVVLVDNGEESGNPTEVVDRVSVSVDNGALSIHEFPMEPSPADESRWTLTLAAGGDAESTIREDSLCIGVYAEIVE